jgi:hypothetical protein
MKRTLVVLSTLLLPAVWACSDSPVQVPFEEELVASEARLVAPAATDAASLQAALDAAALTGGMVVVRGTIVLDDPLTYVSDNSLTIMGQRGARIVGPFDAIDAPSSSSERVGEETVGDALQILGEPDLTLRNLTFDGQTGHGIYFELTDDATGTVNLDLNGVTFTDQGLSAIWFEDQAGGSQAMPDPINSDASVHLDFTRVTVMGTGFADGESEICDIEDEDDPDFGCEWADFDGMRFNEGGLGDITFRFRGVDINGNAGDGIEFDEVDDGHVNGSVVNSFFNKNGSQPQFPQDIEDGFDIDEAGPGGIHLALDNTQVSDNIDEGTDLDENGSGDVRFTARRLVATGNVDENIKITESEDDPTGTGDIILHMSNVTADGALEGRGTRFEEFGEGGVVGSITSSSFSGNLEDTGLRIDEEGEGSIDVALNRVLTNDNDGRGIRMTEDGMGDIIAVLQGVTSTGNGDIAVRLQEENEGAHDVTIRGSTIIGEGGEDSLSVEEEDDGSSTVTIRGSTVDPAPVAPKDPVVFN